MVKSEASFSDCSGYVWSSSNSTMVKSEGIESSKIPFQFDYGEIRSRLCILKFNQRFRVSIRLWWNQKVSSVPAPGSNSTMVKSEDEREK